MSHEGAPRHSAASSTPPSGGRREDQIPELVDSRILFDILNCFPLPDNPVDILSWPPDVFAVTARLLLDTEGYRFVVSPPGDEEWPPGSDWASVVTRVAFEWVEAIGQPDTPLPEELSSAWGIVWAARDTEVETVKRGERWDVIAAVLTLHAFADQAAVDLGHKLDPSSQSFEGRAWRTLAETGTLSHFPPWLIRVLPKSHLGLGGINLRSLSRYLAAHTGQIDVSWTRLPLGDLDTRDVKGTSYNLLLLPWPLEVRRSDFRQWDGPLREMPTKFGFFRYSPANELDLAYVESALKEALATVAQVDGIVLPESAISAEELPALELLSHRYGAYFLVSGVRRDPTAGRLGENYAHIGMWHEGRWHRLRANKHHRWGLDDSQLHQYGLVEHLDTRRLWWEAIKVPLREMHILDVGGGATTSVVICEDLARLDVVAEVLRYVGPTLVITLLMDGPQLANRWSARYASVLADDPGSTVLTLTSLGMAELSNPAGHPPSRSVALWKDPERGLRQIELPEGATAALLQIGESRKTVWTADGRQHDGRTPRLILDSATPIFAAVGVNDRMSMSPSQSVGSGQPV